MSAWLRRVKDVAPLFAYGSGLWLCDVGPIPLGLLLIYFSTGCSSGIVLAADSPASALTENATLAAIVGVLMTAFIGLSGWVIIDRLGWARKDKQIEVNTGRLDKLEDRLSKATLDGPSRNEHDDLKELVVSYHAEYVQRFDALDRKFDSKLDRLLRMVAGKSKEEDVA